MVLQVHHGESQNQNEGIYHRATHNVSQKISSQKEWKGEFCILYLLNKNSHYIIFIIVQMLTNWSLLQRKLKKAKWQALQE